LLSETGLCVSSEKLASEPNAGGSILAGSVLALRLRKPLVCAGAIAIDALPAVCDRLPTYWNFSRLKLHTRHKLLDFHFGRQNKIRTAAFGKRPAAAAESSAANRPPGTGLQHVSPQTGSTAECLAPQTPAAALGGAVAASHWKLVYKHILI
jgi:hypothetical protein